MKKILFLLALMFFAALPARAVEIQDVAPDNWAYESIQKLVDRGYIALYENSQFRGDLPVSRTIFAAALAKLIDQIERGELKLSAVDLKEIKKLGEEFSSDMSDYDTKLSALQKRIEDIESGKVVIQADISKSVVEFRDKFDQLAAENEKLKQELAMVEDQLSTLSEGLKSETKKRKSSTSSLWIGVVAAIAAGLASN